MLFWRDKVSTGHNVTGQTVVGINVTDSPEEFSAHKCLVQSSNIHQFGLMDKRITLAYTT